MIEQRKCNGCSQWLAVDLFPRDRSQACGYGSRCRSCKNAAQRVSKAIKRDATRTRRHTVRLVELDRAATLAAANDWRGPVTDGPLVPALGVRTELGRARRWHEYSADRFDGWRDAPSHWAALYAQLDDRFSITEAGKAYLEGKGNG